MSYALWLHPEGLPCQVFVSHAWAEGIFEFSHGVRSAWPSGRRLTNLYCCLLANPQNLDLEVFLNVDPLMNPFAQALQRASHILVIPNSKISIYSRLWCVYEAYLGTTMGKVCLMPASPTSWQLRSSWAKVLLLPFVLGTLASLLWRLLIYPMLHHHVVFAVILTALGVTVLGSLWGMLPPQLEKCACFALFLHSLGLFLAVAACVPWWSLPYDHDSGAGGFLHYFIPCALCLVNVMCLMRLEMQLLEFRELGHQARNLSCHTVLEAECTNPLDYDRIRGAIRGFENDVDINVRVLMLAGAYTSTLRRAYDSGEDIRGAGILNLRWKVAIGATFWCCCGLDCSTRFDSDGIARTSTEVYWNILSVSSAFLVAIFIPLWLCHGNHGPDWVRGTLHAWYLCAVGAMAMPYLVAALQGWKELSSMSMIQRMMDVGEPHLPSLATSIVEIASPVLFALVSVISGVVASKTLLCRYGPYGQVRRFVIKANRTFTNSSSDSSDSSSSDSDDAAPCCMLHSWNTR
eukprot:Skav234118  [mRNA]  locus=scaffold4383:15126:16776:- [translate_table: standard]